MKEPVIMKNIFTSFVLLGMLFISSCSDDNENCCTFASDCDSVSEVIEETVFEAVPTDNYFITSVSLNQDCLEITFGASGCDGSTWETSLYSSDAFDFIFPPQRAVKLELIDLELCEAVFQKTISFDLTPFQIEGQNEINLNIHGWEDTVLYTY